MESKKKGRLTEKELNDFLKGRPENIQELFFLVRDYVFKNYLLAEEKLMWGMPTYLYKGIKTNYIMVNKNHITFGFYFGNQLKDPERILEGVGKNLRHVKIRKREDLKSKELVQLMKQALKYSLEMSKE